MRKNEIRKIYLEKRRHLSREHITQCNLAMVERFRAIMPLAVGTVFSYSPISRYQEFDIRTCERLLTEAIPELKIAHPRINPGTTGMQAILIDDESNYKDNDYAIAEPSHGEVVNPAAIDLVIVPLVAFDRRGYRVGYGKGFYDRYLTLCRPDVIKLGFSYFEATGAVDDINEFDVPLNLCITPMRVYEF